MGRSIQFLSRIIFLLIISFSAVAQAPKVPKKTTDSITTIKDQYGFTRYSISPDKLAYFYVCQKNLKLIEKEVANLKNAYDTLTIKNKELEANHKKQIDSLLQIKKLLEEQLNCCKSVVLEVDKDNSNLQNSLERVKKNRKYYYIAGVATPIVLTVVAVIVKNSLIP